MIKKIVGISCIFLILSGCYDYHEIENYTIVTAVAIDKTYDNLITVCIEVIKFDKDDYTVYIVEAIGENYPEAINNAILLTGNELYFSHTQVIIISEAVANDGMYPLIDTFYRNQNLRFDMTMLIAKNVEAKEILIVESQIDDIAGLQIKEIIDSNKVVSEIPSMQIYEFFNDISSEGISASLPTIELTTDYKDELTRYISGYAIFKGDELDSFLDKNNTKTLGLLKNKTQSGKVINEYTETTPTYNLEYANCKITPEIFNNHLKYVFEIELDLKLDQLNENKTIISAQERKKLEEEISEAVRKDVIKLIELQIEESETDFLGLGQILYEKYPKIWEENKDNFENILKNIEFSVKVSSEIVSIGNMVIPIDIKS